MTSEGSGDAHPGRPLPAGTVLAVVGPTATGKSDLAVALARRLGGEILNADALQLYQGMDIGTAKLSLEERAGVPHHLLDVLRVTQEASLAAYQGQVQSITRSLIERAKLPIVTGGSGLYLRAALDELNIPPTDPAVRARWEIEAGRCGPVALHALLRERDPVAAAKILPGNVRRVVRALEVIELTGLPFSATLPTGRYLRPTLQIGLRVPRAVLDARIGARVERMFAKGLADETRTLIEAGLREGRTASRALGYAQVLRMLSGEIDLSEAKADTIRATRRLARRQESWFRPDRRIVWLEATLPDGTSRPLDELTEAALAALLAAGPTLGA